VTLLDSLTGPADLRGLSDEELDSLAGEIRTRLIEAVAAHGGHLGPNLGVVELTMAVHRVFESPRDRIIWDTGHQSYVHKMLTGRAAAFDRLRQADGLSGSPTPNPTGSRTRMRRRACRMRTASPRPTSFWASRHQSLPSSATVR
jgi:1-deoxy-D-xylulose-5-phosphate synthase